MRIARALALVLVLSGPAAAQPHVATDPAAIASEVEADIRRTVRALESKNGWVSLDALEYLGYFGRAALGPLLEELGSESPNGRAFAAAALARIPDERSIAPLAALLDDGAGVVLNTLSEDGESLHPVYPRPEHTVKLQAQIALQTITGKRFPDAAAWRAFVAKGNVPIVARPERAARPLPATARWLRGVRICLDPGHGGDRHKHGYKRGLTYLSEADVNLRVARYLRDHLERAGAVVVLTRHGDRDVSIEDRPRIAALTSSSLFLSIHHNWSPRLEQVTTSTWYHMTPDTKPASLDLARHVQGGVTEALELEEPHRAGGLMSDRLMYETGFGVLRHLSPEIPGALCEATYYSSFPMERRLRDPATLEREAWGMFLGLARYIHGGIPRAEVLAASRDAIVLQVRDGLEDRGEWARPFQVLAEHTIVKVDGQRVPHEWDADKGRITLRGPHEPGPHEVEVALINVNKNHSWPKRIRVAVD